MYLALNSEEVHWGMTFAAASSKQTYKFNTRAILEVQIHATSEVFVQINVTFTLYVIRIYEFTLPLTDMKIYFCLAVIKILV